MEMREDMEQGHYTPWSWLSTDWFKEAYPAALLSRRAGLPKKKKKRKRDKSVLVRVLSSPHLKMYAA